jgi:hypothetical protein
MRRLSGIHMSMDAVVRVLSCTSRHRRRIRFCVYRLIDHNSARMSGLRPAVEHRRRSNSLHRERQGDEPHDEETN